MPAIDLLIIVNIAYILLLGETRSESGFPICQEHDHDPSKNKRVTANSEFIIITYVMLFHKCHNNYLPTQ